MSSMIHFVYPLMWTLNHKCQKYTVHKSQALKRFYFIGTVLNLIINFWDGKHNVITLLSILNTMFMITVHAALMGYTSYNQLLIVTEYYFSHSTETVQKCPLNVGLQLLLSLYISSTKNAKNK